MIPELLQERAALYVAGAMSAQEREQFEMLLEFHEELRALVASLSEIGADLARATCRPDAYGPSPGLKARILDRLRDRPQRAASDALVMCGPDTLVQWVNPAFTEMCGYTLEELSGKKLSTFLQGEKTDREAAARMRHAVHARLPCHETILNYHKNGTPYWSEIELTPILDDAGEPVCFLAREREVMKPLPA